MYDAIIVGAGHNGLCLAAYLQRAGLSTLIVERLGRTGGMAATEEPLLVGFRHNPHANYLSYHSVMPAVRDFELEELGLRTLMPDAQHGLPFSDGAPPVVLYRPDLSERTWASVAYYSRADADLYLDLKQRALRVEDLLAQVVYSPPSGERFDAQIEAFDQSFAALGLASASVGAKTAAGVIADLFESQQMRTLMSQLATEFGVAINAEWSGLGFLASALWMIGNRRLPLGGMASMARALTLACKREGVAMHLGAPVERILVEDGRATGVLVAAHGPIRGSKIVAVSAPIGAAYLNLVGADFWSETCLAEIERFVAAPVPTIASSMFCLREPPNYRSARWNGDIDRCLQTIVGVQTIEDVLGQMREINNALLPVPVASTHVNTLWDASQAPPGFHVAGADSFFPDVDALDERTWRDVALSYNEALLTRWREFAPNMHRGNVIADGFDPPTADFERKVLLREGAAQYRTEIDGLYLCGAGTHPGGGIHGACGYNAYQVIAADLGLPGVGQETAT
jgi:phytoene dehydrogenase-like protein